MMLAPAESFASAYDVVVPGSFIEQASGARALGMGRAFGAVAEGPGSLIWNPAGLGRAARNELSFNYLSLFEGASLQEISWASNYNRPFGLGASLVNYVLPGIVARDSSGNISGETRDSKIGFLLGGAVEPRESWTLGISAKLMRQSLAGSSASALDFDLGLLKVFDRCRTGLQFQNLLGSALAREGGEDRLLRGARIGGAARLFGSTLLSADVLIRAGGGLGFRGGLEYSLLNAVFLRAGMDGVLPSAGVGFTLGRSGVDYAALSSPILGLSHRMSLRWGLGEGPEAKLAQRRNWKLP